MAVHAQEQEEHPTDPERQLPGRGSGGEHAHPGAVRVHSDGLQVLEQAASEHPSLHRDRDGPRGVERGPVHQPLATKQVHGTEQDEHQHDVLTRGIDTHTQEALQGSAVAGFNERPAAQVPGCVAERCEAQVRDDVWSAHRQP